MFQKIPYLIALAGMFMGVFIAILFGVNENLFKDQIKTDLDRNPKVLELRQSDDPEVKANVEHYLGAEAEKNWRYYQRFHFHSTGIGAMSVCVLLLLSFLAAPASQVLLASYTVAIGGFLYPWVWLFSGLYGPSLGRDVAKESFAFFGYMGGVFMIGIAFTIYLIVVFPLRFTTSQKH